MDTCFKFTYFKFTGAIAIAIYVTIALPASGTVVFSSRPASPLDLGVQRVDVSGMSKPAEPGMVPGAKTSSSYEPPVEGGPQTSQGSGTR
jgi:hypothetical protein